MDVSTNSLSTRAKAPSGFAYGKRHLRTDAEDQVLAPSRTAMPYGDSLGDAALALLPRKSSSANQRKMSDAQKALKKMQILRLISYGFTFVCAFAFSVMALQPLLLPLFTFGYCFIGGVHEWLEFSLTAWKISAVPLFLGLFSAAGVWYTTRQVHILTENFNTLSEIKLPVLPR